MSLGDTLTEAFQVELRETLFHGCRDCPADAQLVVMEFLDGFGVPPTRDADVARPMRHGLFASPQFLDGRSMLVSIMARGVTQGDLHTARTALGSAWAPVDVSADELVIELAFTLDDPATKYFVRGKPQRAEWGYAITALLFDLEEHVTDTALCEFLATDPAIYALTTGQISLSLGEASGGHGFPLGFPHGFGTATSGADDAVNAGNFTTYPVITVTAGGSGASGIGVTNTTTGKEWEIILTLSAGETLVIDMAARTAKLNGTADRSPFVNRPPSEWWGLEPGSNVLNLVATGAGTSAVVEWHDAYLI